MRLNAKPPRRVKSEAAFVFDVVSFSSQRRSGRRAFEVYLLVLASPHEARFTFLHAQDRDETEEFPRGFMDGLFSGEDGESAEAVAPAIHHRSLEPGPECRMFRPHELLDGEVGGGHAVGVRAGGVALPVAVMEQCFGQIGEAGMLEHTAEERVIFGRREHGFVAEAVFFQHGSAYHDGRMAQGAARHQGRSDVAVREGEFPRLLRDHVPDLTAHDAHLGVSVEKGDLLFEAFGQGDVIMIHDGEILALSHIEQTVARRRNAEIALVDSVDDARIGVGLHHLFNVGID